MDLLAVSLRDKHFDEFAVGGVFPEWWVSRGGNWVGVGCCGWNSSGCYGMAILLFWWPKALNFVSAILRMCA